jgi:hypothetical protein
MIITSVIIYEKIHFKTRFLRINRTITHQPCNMVKTKKVIFAKRFVGEPKKDDFEVVEEELPPLKKGGKIVKTKCLGRQNSHILLYSYGVQGTSNSDDSLLHIPFEKTSMMQNLDMGFVTYICLLLRLLITCSDTSKDPIRCSPQMLLSCIFMLLF